MAKEAVQQKVLCIIFKWASLLFTRNRVIFGLKFIHHFLQFYYIIAICTTQTIDIDSVIDTHGLK